MYLSHASILRDVLDVLLVRVRRDRRAEGLSNVDDAALPRAVRETDRRSKREAGPNPGSA